MKTCNKCKSEKPLNDFSKNRRSKDGRQPSCVECNKNYRIKNKDKIRESRAASYAENRESRLLARSIYRENHKEKVREGAIKWQGNNPVKLKLQTAAWQKANPEARRANESKRRAARAGSDGAHTAADIKIIFQYQNGLCANCHEPLILCGKKIFHIDHIMPLALGGSNGKGNLQCLCPTCNLRKRAKDPIEWAKENGRLL